MTLTLALKLSSTLTSTSSYMTTLRKRRQNVWPRTECLPLGFLVLLSPLSTPLSMWQTISTTTTITGKYCAKYDRRYMCTYLCFYRNNNNNDNNNNQVNTNIANSANMQISIGKHLLMKAKVNWCNNISYNIFIINIHMSTSMAMTGRQGWADRLRSVSSFFEGALPLFLGKTLAEKPRSRSWPYSFSSELQLVALCFFSCQSIGQCSFTLRLKTFALQSAMPSTHANCRCCCIWAFMTY